VCLCCLEYEKNVFIFEVLMYLYRIRLVEVQSIVFSRNEVQSIIFSGNDVQSIVFSEMKLM